MYTCADCAVRACEQEAHETLPKNCPIRNRELMEASVSVYEREEYRGFYLASAEIEAEGYTRWPRLKETIEFAKRMGYRRLGLAFCAGLATEAKIVAGVLRGN
jgi:uncharacterized metal-binding protein